MKFVDEYRDSARLRRQLAALRARITRRWVIMDVCGGQTHALLRHGLEAALDDVLELIHGPGCPVCVTPSAVIDDAITLAESHGVILVSFGDMLRVPGARGSLVQARARGADVRSVYSPLDAVELAARHPAREVVFLGVGFETTAPATALAVLQSRRRGLANFSLLCHHVRVEPAMRALLQDPGNRVQGFLAAGHVCTVTGCAEYAALVDEYRVPVVVTGFEPVDLLDGLRECVDLLEANTPRLRNAYARSARHDGNPQARRLMDTVYTVATLPWRGFGAIPEGGLQLRPDFRDADARLRFGLATLSPDPHDECRGADILTGRIKPLQCPLFGNLCTPESPVGAPMVSSEGACAAYFRYARTVESDHA